MSLAFGSASINKENSTHTESREVQKLKLQLSDRLFELRKIQEDNAEHRAKIQISHFKEKAQLNKVIIDLQQRMSQQNLAWGKKVDEVREHYKIQKEQTVFKMQEQQHIMQQKIRTQIHEQYRIEITELQASIKNLRSQNESMTDKMMAKMQRQFQVQRQKHQKSVKQLLQHKQHQIYNLQQQIQQWRQTCKQQQQHNKVTKSQCDGELQKKQSQLAQLRENKMQLLQLQQKMQDIREGHRQEIIKKEQQHRQNIQALQKNIGVVQEDNECSINKLKMDSNQAKDKLHQEYGQCIVQMQSALQEMQQLNRSKEELWQKRGHQVLRLYQNLSTKQQDRLKIQSLQIELLRKDFELGRQKQELKSCKLQLGNMQDVYERVFSIASRQHSKSFKMRKLKIPGSTHHNNRFINNHHQ